MTPLEGYDRLQEQLLSGKPLKLLIDILLILPKSRLLLHEDPLDLVYLLNNPSRLLIMQGKVFELAISSRYPLPYLRQFRRHFP